MFSTRRNKFYLVLISSLYFISCAASLDADVDDTITIPLNNSVTYDEREIHGEFIILNASETIKVNFENISTDLEFVIFQVHTQFQSILLYRNNSMNDDTVNGTNVGMISILNKQGAEPKADVFYIQNPNVNNTVQAYISVHGYYPDDPYPGGCNMDGHKKMPPYLYVTTETDYILVQAHTSSSDKDCRVVNTVEDTFYMMYLPETSYSADDYFKGIRSMMSLKTIRNNGWEIPQTNDMWFMKRMLSAYPGTGVILTAVATITDENKTLYAVYVPGHSYGCPNVDEHGCIYPEDIISPVLCALLLFGGVFVSFLGHRFFKTEMFLAGMFSGFIITYILVSSIDTTGLTVQSLVAASTLCSLFFGAMWLLFWWLYGVPVIAILVPTFNVGFVLASVVYYRIPVYVHYLQDDFNFWSVYVMIMLLSSMALLSIAFSANLLCCAFLGGFCTMYAFDYGMGSNLKYIIINTIRRAVVPNFKYAYLSPPFQWRDCFVTMVWVSIALAGWGFQHWYNRGRFPFPPPPRSTRLTMPEATNYGALTEETRRQVRHITTIRHHLTGAPVVSRTYSERTYLLADGNQQT